MAKLPPQFEVTIDKLVFGGEGLGYYEGRPIFVYGVLPGEKVRVVPIKVNRKFAKAKLIEVISASPDRIENPENHYLSTSPWQIMDYASQLKYKKELITEVFSKLSTMPLPQVDITSSQTEWGYRNKMEFSFCEENGEIYLGFHQRYRHRQFYKVEEAKIAHPQINQVAQLILQELRNRKTSVDLLKNLLVRYSYHQNKCTAVLYVTDESFPIFDITLPELVGWQIAYSRPETPAAVTTKVLYKSGDDFLLEKIDDKIFKYFYPSFFQVNPPSFVNVSKDLHEKLPSGEVLADLYAGCGLIGFLLSDKFKTTRSIEFDHLGTKAAEYNVVENHLTNIELINGLVEKQDLSKLLKDANVIIIDPPRDGLAPKALGQLMETAPRCLAYLSCNPATQARDWKELSKIYNAKFWRLYDFYPQTPHVESLIIAEKV